MDKNRIMELESIVGKIWKQFESFGTQKEEFIPAEEAAEDRKALGRRIGRLYLSFARVLISRLGEKEAKKAILDAIRDYAYYCAEARKRGLVDLPQRGIHEKAEVVEEKGRKLLRTYGCSIAQEFADQGEEKLGALYCYIDPCSFMLTTPNVKLYHKQIKPLGSEFCEMDVAIVSNEEMNTVLEKGRDYRDVDPIIKHGTEGPLLKEGLK
jgi:hypothetical protein